jgi:hypothetical protein
MEARFKVDPYAWPDADGSLEFNLSPARSGGVRPAGINVQIAVAPWALEPIHVALLDEVNESVPCGCGFQARATGEIGGRDPATGISNGFKRL